jgi:hypothetical protein
MGWGYSNLLVGSVIQRPLLRIQPRRRLNVAEETQSARGLRFVYDKLGESFKLGNLAISKVRMVE